MSAIVNEVYDAFRSAGVSDEQATAAARSIPMSESLATKADIGDVRAEIGELRTEMGELRTEMGELRTEMRAEIGELRTEMRTEIGELRTEMRTEIGELRTELRTDIGAVRTEMKDLELRMTVKFFTGLGIAVAGVKALDFLIG